jgi:serine/threonine-protein kinase
MAEVLIAERTARPGEPVILKRVVPHLSADQTVVALFAHEIRLMKALSHRAIPAVLDDGTDSRGAPFLVLEYVRGASLAGAVEKGVSLSPGAWCAVADELLDALAHVHERAGADGKGLEIVHRDVNSSNVLLGVDGAVKLVDFGIASSTARPPDKADADRGTPGYVAPEVLTGESQGDVRSDIFSAAVVLYEGATGARLFGGNRFAAMNAIVEGTVAPLSSHRKDLAAFDAFVARAVAKEPGQRFPTASAMRDEFRATAGKAACSPDREGVAGVARQLVV